ncbi:MULTISPECIES: nuclear transport factor 2 family protein [unclassified Vreelandella]
MRTPHDVLNEWMQAINDADVEALLALYDDNAVLIPTFSNRIANNSEKHRDYFERLGARPGLSITLHEKTLIIQEMSETLCSLTGLYNWRFEVEGELLNFEARFSYVVDLSKEAPILHHHSSQIPRML